MISVVSGGGRSALTSMVAVRNSAPFSSYTRAEASISRISSRVGNSTPSVRPTKAISSGGGIEQIEPDGLLRQVRRSRVDMAQLAPAQLESREHAASAP